MRLKPRATIGLLLWLLYLVVIVVLQKSSGVAYDEFGDSSENLARGILPSLVVGSVVIGGLAVWLGWWRAALRDEHTTRIGWTLAAPALYLVIALSMFAFTDWGSLTVGFVLAALAMGVFVGFAEELVCRGVLLVGLRGSVQEVAVWALTCLMFGMMHGLNIFLGAPVAGTVVQIVLAAMQGSSFYIIRRYSGSLVWAMLLHGLWDFAVTVQEKSDGGDDPLFALMYVAGVLALIGGFVVARRSAAGPSEDYARGASDASPVAA
jgi:uncharacterized protein